MLKLLRKQKLWLGKFIVAALLLTLVSPCLAEAKEVLGANAQTIEASSNEKVPDNTKNPMEDIAFDQDVDGHCCMNHGAKLSFDTHKTFLFSLRKITVSMHKEQSLPNDFLLGLFRPPQA